MVGEEDTQFSKEGYHHQLYLVTETFKWPIWHHNPMDEVVALCLNLRPVQQEEYHDWSWKPSELVSANEIKAIGGEYTIIKPT